MNEPELRFSGFTDEWSKYRLADITSKIGSGKTPRGGSDVYTKNGVYLIRSQNVLNEGLDLNDAAYIDDKTDEDMKNSRVKFGDVLLNITGASIGRCAVFKEHVRANVNQHVCIIRPKNSSFVSDFIQMKLISEDGQNQIKVNQAGGGRQGLNFAQIGNISFYFPDVAEQQKIADLFSTLDNVINSVQKEVDSWEQMKRGVMQKLFGQEVRFKADDGSEFPEWEKIKIKNIFDITRGYVLATDLTTDCPDKNNKYPVYSSQTKDNGLMGYYSKYLYENAITWTTDGANAGTVKYRTGKFYCTNVCGVLLNKEGYANQCVAEILGTVSKRYVSYVGNPKLMNNVMADISIQIPSSLKEQQKIADCLSEFDLVIEKTKQKLEAYKQLKNGLMQRMFV